MDLIIFFGNLDGSRSLRRFTCLTILQWHEILSHKMAAMPQQCSSLHGKFCSNFSSGIRQVIVTNKTISSGIKARFAKRLSVDK